jgi:hypothetical protein
MRLVITGIRIITNIKNLDVIHRPVLYLEHGVLKTGLAIFRWSQLGWAHLTELVSVSGPDHRHEPKVFSSIEGTAIIVLFWY